MALTPLEIKSSEKEVTILWSDQHRSRYDPRALRLACRCAACVDEKTQESRIHADQIPIQIKAKGIQVVGNYALQFTWSDSHGTGIYAYDFLRAVCGCAVCREPREFDV
jgi:ATP-binding protein involved in chromosome partitioning